jgi:hypothetical protein
MMRAPDSLSIVLEAVDLLVALRPGGFRFDRLKFTLSAVIS